MNQVIGRAGPHSRFKLLVIPKIKPCHRFLNCVYYMKTLALRGVF